MMMYISPFVDTIIVEFRLYRDGRPPRPAVPLAGGCGTSSGRRRARAYGAQRGTLIRSRRAARLVLPGRRPHEVHAPRGGQTPPDRPDDPLPRGRRPLEYTFSIWGFTDDRYADAPRVLRLGRGVLQRTGWRRPPDVGSAWRRTRSAFSYTSDWNGMTIDPCRRAGPGGTSSRVQRVLRRARREAAPQPDAQITHEHARKAFGDRLDRFEGYRRRFDPDDRLLNGLPRPAARAAANHS